MKRYGFLYEKVYEMDNLRFAHKNARKGKTHYREVKKIDTDPERYCQEIQKMLKEKTFSNSKYTEMQKMTDSGKVRTIHKLPYFPDRIIHHAIIQIVEPIWVKSLIKDTYACIPGRGIHKGVTRIKRALRDQANTTYCLKMDIKKYYPSINNKVLKQIIRRKIKDPNLLWLLDEIIDSAQGIPIGNYLSQYFGNLYLNGYDHYMKEKMGCKYYFRYCDDIVILHKDKARLHALRKETQQYLQNLKLKVKGNYQVFPVAVRGIDFLGYKFFHSHVLVRKSIAKKFKKSIRQINKDWKRMNPITVISKVMSYLGWFKYANSHNLYKKYIDDKLFWIVGQKSKEMGIANPLQGFVA